MHRPGQESSAILALLRDRHNVLLSGPPGTGKSRTLAEVASAFCARTMPLHVPGAPVAIPRDKATSSNAALPSPERKDRRVFRTVFHQNTKYRDFLTGIAPVVGEAQATSFRITRGTLYRASEHARTPDGASLVIIDEINRGPAVQVFGGSIVALESDKRLAPDGSRHDYTQLFEITSPDTGDSVEYALPHHLYILAAMNQADTSVEPLDVAFLRRWVPFKLAPDEAILRAYFALPARSGIPLPEQPGAVADVYEAAARAWAAVNERIQIGRGAELQVGHGIFMAKSSPAQSMPDALSDMAECWRILRAHVDEVFFGDVRGAAAALNAGAEGHPFALHEVLFGDQLRVDLRGPSAIGAAEVYRLMRAVAG